ncbi:MAG: hypothetical protein ACTSWA_06225 [Candidatus Thorarchaeota archaeon]
MKLHYIQKIHHSKAVQFQRFGHLRISGIDNFLALLTYRLGPVDPQSKLQVSPCLVELRWSRRGLVIVYIEMEEEISATEILYDCTDCTTWAQILDVLSVVSRLAE